MPSKRTTKQQTRNESTPAPETPAIAPTAVSVMVGPSSSSSTPVPTASRSTPSTPKHERPNSNHLSADYVSPLKKLKKTMQHHKRLVIDTIDDLREFIEHNDVADSEIRASIRIQARLLWTANECIHGLRFLRLYLGEQRAPEPLHEQQTEYQEAQRDDPYQANQYLITLSLYDIPADHPKLPPLGSVIAFVPTKLRIYRECCQVESKLHQIATVSPP